MLDILYIKTAASFANYTGNPAGLFLLPGKGYFYSNFKDFYN
jgi:hypothetical protein